MGKGYSGWGSTGKDCGKSVRGMCKRTCDESEKGNEVDLW